MKSWENNFDNIVQEKRQMMSEGEVPILFKTFMKINYIDDE